MSLELLLPLLLVLLPLVEWLLRRWRTVASRDQPADQGRPRVAVPGPPPSLPPPVPLPEHHRPAEARVEATPPAWKPRAQRAHEKARAATPGRGRDQPRSRHAPPSVAARSRRSGTALGRIARGDIHRGIVLMTVLGPCRADRPHAWPDDGR